MQPDIEAIAIQTLASHVRKLTILTDDMEATEILSLCANSLEDRADELRQEARNNPPPTQPTGTQP